VLRKEGGWGRVAFKVACKGGGVRNKGANAIIRILGHSCVLCVFWRSLISMSLSIVLICMCGPETRINLIRTYPLTLGLYRA
jgi:hypothetical protein